MANRTGKSGPPRKPTALKLLHGTFRADTSAKHEPKPASDATVPKPPKHLTLLAKAEWIRTAAELHPLGLLTRPDYSTLEMYCETYASWRRAIKTKDQPGGRSFAQLAHRFLTEFGMTPASRSRINVLLGASEEGTNKSQNNKGFA